MRKRFICVMMIILILLCLCACSEKETGDVNFGEYELSETEMTSLKYNPDDVLSPDESWQNAYALSYSFYDKQKSGSESIIVEGRCGKYYQALDRTSDIISFFSQEDGYIIQYLLDGSTKTGTSAIVTGSSMDELYSGFTQFSVCDPYFPVYTNVTKVGEDFVANRSASRYKQIETQDGKETRIAYVWIDDAYGFASKCELYDAVTQELQMRWELLSFTQNVSEESIKVPVEEYELTEE